MAAASSPPRRPLAVRYSLRMLLLALTAFAIGFPIWYRWPYEEDDPEMGKIWGAKRIVTWQRQWGGGRLMHGPEEIYYGTKMESRRTYRNGVLHGPFELAMRGGGQESGQYIDGKREGLWIARDSFGKPVRNAVWSNDVLDGQYETWELGEHRTLQFSKGRLISDGVAMETGLQALLANDRISDFRLENALSNLTRVELINVPLKDAFDFIAAQHGIPILIDLFHAEPSRPVSGIWTGLDLASALTILTADHGHACDYRYGSVWITSPEDAKNWRDPTGVAEIEPTKDSELAKSWDEPVTCNANKQQLASLLTNLAQPLAIDVDSSAVQSAEEADGKYLVTQSLNGHPFRHALGILLYQTRCGVKLDGESLVILPPTDGL